MTGPGPKRSAALALVAWLLCAAACSDALRVEQGPLVAEPSQDAALLWARAAAPASLEVQLRDAGGWGRVRHAEAHAESDNAVVLKLTDLGPGRRHLYRARFSRRGPLASAAGPWFEGSFRTAPAPDDARPARIAFGGDLAGQNVCRDAKRGFPVFEAIAERGPDLFLGLGDMIYADGTCAARGLYGNAQIPGPFPPSTELEHFRAHWRYARADPAFRSLLRHTSYVTVWDDHEVKNDFGADEPLLPLGRRAFLEHNPIRGATAGGGALYRRLRWGRHFELFLLDARSHRDANAASDNPERGKTLLGREQRAWLEEGLAASDATWKIVVSSVPISIPTGAGGEAGRDGWSRLGSSTGFSTELGEIWRAMRAAEVRDVVWITTDVHFASVFRYPIPPSGPDWHLYEVVTGPLNAGLFPKRIFDPWLRAERLFFHGPERPGDVTSFEEALGWFNFGLLEAGADGTLAIRVVDARGRTLYELELEPAAGGSAGKG